MDELTVDGKKLKQFREARGLTQGQLAVKARVGQGHISRIEGGLRPNAHIATVAKLASALDVTVDDLLVRPVRKDLADDLPDFHIYVSRKFKGNPKFQKALVMAYEAIRSVQEELDEEEREHESE